MLMIKLWLPSDMLMIKHASVLGFVMIVTKLCLVVKTC